MTLLQHHLVALGLIALTSSILGFFILWKNPRKFINRIFALYTVSVAWWAFWEFLTEFSPNQAVAVTRLRIEYLGVCFMPSLFYHCATSLIGTRKRFELLTYYLLSSIFTVFISILRHSSFLPEAAPIAYLPFWAKAGPFYILFVLFFSSVIARAHQLLWNGFWKEPRGLKRQQLKYFFFSSALAYVAAIPEFSLKLGIRIPYVQPFGLYTVPLYMVLVAYIIIQFKLFDINVVIRKSLVYSLLITLLTAGYFGLVYGIEKAFQTAFGYHSPWVSLTAFALMTIAFQPLKWTIQRLVDWLVFRTSQEQLAKRMERLEGEAKQTEKLRAISTLAAGMAHEIKNPLTAIHTFAEFVPEKHADPEFARKLHEVLTTETKRIQRIVQEVLDFAKPKTPRIQPLDLKLLLESTLDLLSGDLLRKKIHCQIDYQHDGAMLPADSDQLRQVLINLIQNATDAMPNGGKLTIATQAVNNHLELTVSDTGTGIPKELLPKIFDPFVTTKSDGNGLGLAMVHSIIRAHGGTIRAESRRSADGSVADQPGHGTTFTISLPL